MTPTQLRAFSAVVRLGSVKAAAAELGVSEAAVSGHVALLRKELDDQLMTRTASGLAFTPGGLRLATRASEMLGLQDRTIREVSEAGHGKRVLRLAASSLFSEYAAPGMIELFSKRADDLDVEMSVRHTGQFMALLASRMADVAIGPTPKSLDQAIVKKTFFKYQIVLVAGAGHVMAGARPRPGQLQEQDWLLGPSAAESGLVAAMVHTMAVPDHRQRIFQSHAAALEEAKRGNGVALALAFAVADDLSAGRLIRVGGRGTQAEGSWSAMTLGVGSVAPAATELMRFITTPRATQAMLSGSGANIGHFKPSVHVTLWS